MPHQNDVTLSLQQFDLFKEIVYECIQCKLSCSNKIESNFKCLLFCNRKVEHRFRACFYILGLNPDFSLFAEEF